ncbi:hypothetical protein KAYACHO_77 [Mycobacterium phage KayaCho]|uniref:hypothetical protein n=1 Tax=Mycobacterium phage KayaCho TaxID=1340830 RepID=UPI000387E637|nr:hypothetical protein N846_gp77 [Mycobacterium phage KayaCho]AGT12981.1 hypothetical protein KAYACHO_77 [Mycobacterium phage KayaCho]
MADHQHYYADRSGGFDWPKCVICGKPVSVDTADFSVRPCAHGVRACCQTAETTDHAFNCQSVDARVKRGLSPFPAP